MMYHDILTDAESFAERKAAERAAHGLQTTDAEKAEIVAAYLDAKADAADSGKTPN